MDWIVVRVVVSDRTEGAGEEKVDGDLTEVAVVVIVWFEGFGADDGEEVELSDPVEGDWWWFLRSSYEGPVMVLIVEVVSRGVGIPGWELLLCCLPEWDLFPPLGPELLL